MILPNAFGQVQKNKMIRMPWIKGLLGVFDFKRFIEVNKCAGVITDIYGTEHDIIAEDIQVILTKSQFKLWKYYDSWEHYKSYYKQYNCTAGYTNPEEDRIGDASINYQMLQTLVDMTDEEEIKMTSQSIDKLNNLSSSIENIKWAFGVTPCNQHKTAFQKAIELYPNLINDEYIKSHLKEIKNSMIKRFKAGKLRVNGKYTFLLPDFYAACEYWFMNNSEPKGLLQDGEVFCWLFRKADKLDCLRSPHLFMEHAIRKNTAWFGCKEVQDKLRKWFCTDAIYTSSHDFITKILQNDVDGDKSLVVADKTIIEVAERCIKKYDIVPLYYNMKKAEPSQINNESIYNGLIEAFTGGNIGIYSNSISKIWNSDIFVSGSDKDKQEALDVIKLLCCENNFNIDRAKTLYMPVRPQFAKELISKFTKNALPHFFKYAKGKEDYQVADVNDSIVNRLNKIIPYPRINCRKLNLGDIDYTLLMSNPNVECRVAFTENGKIIKDQTSPLIVKYHELTKKYYLSLDSVLQAKKSISSDILTNSQLRRDFVYGRLIKEIREELLQYGDDNEVSDVLVKYLYGIKKSKNKTTLWLCYGETIYNNLEKNVKCKTKEIQCIDCGKWFNINIKDNQTNRCSECYSEYRKEYYREKKRGQRAKLKVLNG